MPKSTTDEALMDRLDEVDRMISSVGHVVIGDRLRRIRCKQQLSIRDVANRAGLSKTSLVRLEQGGRTRATTVLAVCSVYGVHVNRLIAASDREGFVSAAVHRHEDERWHDLRDFGSGHLFGADRPLTREERRRAARGDGAIPLCMLASRLPDGGVLPCILELFAPTEERSHAGEEFVYVLSGKAVVTVGSREYVLDTNESLSFRSAEKHKYAPAPGSRRPARILSVRVDG